jgi:dihydrodipicolinate synthase/N-acetylneuraminate lyase
MSERFVGVLPALITPFTPDGGAIDTDALAAIVDRLVGAGVGGLVPGGSTGEFTTLSHAERRQLIEVTVEAASGRVPVVAGTGALSTRETVELSVHAERAGAAAVMIVPPFYDALSWPELLAHYTAVADAIEIPIMYYNLPSASGVKLTAAQLRELPVACLKDTGGDAVAATELIQCDGPALLNGWDTLTFASLAAGVRAVVWGVASIVPEQCIELHRVLIDDIDLPAARAVGPPVAAVPVPGEAELPGRREDRLQPRRRYDRAGPAAPAPARPGDQRRARRAGGPREARGGRPLTRRSPRRPSGPERGQRAGFR